MDEFFIRKLETQYVDGAFQVEKICLAEGWSKTAISALLTREDVVYLVATAGENVCGIAGMYLVLDEGQITNVAVLPAYRKQGIGKLLIQQLIETGKTHGVNLFTLEVASRNATAIKLYGGFGFQTVGHRKGFYKDDDAVLMNCLLC